jgi:hypothetical protein
MSLAYQDLGPQTFKNVPVPVHIYRVTGEEPYPPDTEGMDRDVDPGAPDTTPRELRWCLRG